MRYRATVDILNLLPISAREQYEDVIAFISYHVSPPTADYINPSSCSRSLFLPRPLSHFSSLPHFCSSPTSKPLLILTLYSLTRTYLLFCNDVFKNHAKSCPCETNRRTNPFSITRQRWSSTSKNRCRNSEVGGARLQTWYAIRYTSPPPTWSLSSFSPSQRRGLDRCQHLWVLAAGPLLSWNSFLTIYASPKNILFEKAGDSPVRSTTCGAHRSLPGGPDPHGQKDLVEASEKTLALHKTYGRSYAVHNPALWDQRKIPCNMISGEQLSRKSRPSRRLRFRPGDVTSIKIVLRWVSDVAKEVSEPEAVSLPEEMFLLENTSKEDSSDDWTDAILKSLESSDDWVKTILGSLEPKSRWVDIVWLVGCARTGWRALARVQYLQRVPFCFAFAFQVWLSHSLSLQRGSIASEGFCYWMTVPFTVFANESSLLLRVHWYWEYLLLRVFATEGSCCLEYLLLRVFATEGLCHWEYLHLRAFATEGFCILGISSIAWFESTWDSMTLLRVWATQDRFRGCLGNEVAVTTKPHPSQLVWQWWEESKTYLVERGLKGFNFMLSCFWWSVAPRDDYFRGILLARDLVQGMRAQRLQRKWE